MVQGKDKKKRWQSATNRSVSCARTRNDGVVLGVSEQERGIHAHDLPRILPYIVPYVTPFKESRL